MGQSVHDGDSMAFGAADLLELWRQPEGASRLRRALLITHLKAAVTPSAMPQEGAKLAAVWAASEPPPALDEIQTALEAALQQGLQLSPSAVPPQAPGDWVPEAVPGMPGFWRLPKTGSVLVSMELRNKALLNLALANAELDATWNGQAQAPSQPLQLRCVLLQPQIQVAPQMKGLLNCVGAALPQGIRGPPDQWRWRPALLSSDASLKSLAAALANPRSRRFLSLAASMNDCQSQGNCSDAQHQHQQEQAAAKAQAAREAAAADQAQRQHAAVQEARTDRNKRLLLLAAIVLGQFVFIGVARATGSSVLPCVLVLGGSGGFSAWIVQSTTRTSADALSLTVMGMVALGVLGAGAVLCGVYATVYRRFFAPG